MEATMKIFAVMPALVADVQAVGKDHTNTFHKYKYRAVDDLMAALHPLLSKHKVTVMPQYSDIAVTPIVGGKDAKECRVSLKLTLDWIAEDGSKLSTVTYGEGVDNGDKATYKAMAGAIKYAILQTLMVPTEETRGKQDPESDPNTDAPKRRGGKKTDGAGPASKGNGSQPPASGDTESDGSDIMMLIAGCQSASDIDGIKKQVRAWVVTKEPKDPARVKVVDEFVAAQTRLGA